MTRTRYTIILLSMIIGFVDFAAKADEAFQPGEVAASDSAWIWFHQTGWNLDENYKGNRDNLDRMVNRIRSNQESDSALMIKKIRVVGSASPEGSVAINDRLSRQRADKIFDYFSPYLNVNDTSAQFEFIGRDWVGLENYVESDNEVPYRDEVLTLLTEITDRIAKDGKDSEENLREFKRLRGGEPYLYLYNRIFPDLRTSRLYVDYAYRYPSRIFLNDLPPAGIEVDAKGPGNAAIIIPESFIVPDRLCRPFYMGIKTNMLYDALALPSLGVEFYLGRNWSVVGIWTYGWWDRNPKHRYWRAYGGDLAVRKWFGKAAEEKPLTGHHIGMYAGVVTYDFEFGGKGYMGGVPGGTLWDRCNFMAGIEYGYSLPIARRFNIDFTIGVGYLTGKVIEYKPYEEEYVYQKTKRLNWVGPTKAEVSLVWLIGCDNYNRGKGGRR